MNLFFWIFLMISSTFHSHSQTSVSIDTLVTSTDEISISYDLTTNLDSLEEFLVEQFYIDSLDTVQIFSGTYNLEEDDASDFTKTSFDFSSNHLKFWIGEFERLRFYARIRLVRVDGSIEIITI